MGKEPARKLGEPYCRGRLHEPGGWFSLEQWLAACKNLFWQNANDPPRLQESTLDPGPAPHPDHFLVSVVQADSFRVATGADSEQIGES